MLSGCDDESIYRVKKFEDVLIISGIARVMPLFGEEARVQFVLSAEHASLVKIPWKNRILNTAGCSSVINVGWEPTAVLPRQRNDSNAEFPLFQDINMV